MSSERRRSETYLSQRSFREELLGVLWFMLAAMTWGDLPAWISWSMVIHAALCHVGATVYAIRAARMRVLARSPRPHQTGAPER